MKPGHIRVFDGLRVTTEHIEHFQSSLHSALQDIREVLGLGRVFRGFDVTRESASSIRVSPGLAFDYRHRRIVSDEPKQAEVQFVDGQDSLFVGVRYEQIERGEIEGRSTLIFDSCSVPLVPVEPTEGDDVVPLARLDRLEDPSQGFAVVDLRATRLKEEVEGRPREEEVQPAGEETARVGEREELREMREGTTAEASLLAETEQPSDGETNVSAISPEVNAESMDDEAVKPIAEEGQTAEPDAIPAPAEDVRAASESKAAFHIKQGVLRFQSDAEGEATLRSMFLDPLRRHLRSADTNADARFALQVGKAAIQPSLEARSLTCHTRISVRVVVPRAPAVGEDETEGAAESERGEAELAVLEVSSEELGSDATDTRDLVVLKGESVSTGEITAGEGTVSQYGIVQILGWKGSSEETAWSSRLVEGSIATLPLRTLTSIETNELEALGLEFLRLMELRIVVEPAENGRLCIEAMLAWEGPVSPEVVQEMQAREFRLHWAATVGWKAVGG